MVAPRGKREVHSEWETEHVCSCRDYGVHSYDCEYTLLYFTCAARTIGWKILAISGLLGPYHLRTAQAPPSS